MKNKKAFTLAEILIATAVIGIVAALSVPTLLLALNGKSNRSKYMKVMSNLTQASTSSYANDSYDFSGTNGYYGELGHPTELYDSPVGASDGAIIGYDTQSKTTGSTHSDLFKDTTSLFHIFQDNLRMKSSKEVSNYAVQPVDISLNCAGRVPEGTTVNLLVSGSPTTTSATVKTDFLAREYWAESLLQGSGGLISLCDGRSLENGGINQGRMFMLEDGSVFTYDPAQAYCFESNPCYGYIDVNGPEGPNRVISCSNGVDSYITSYSKNALAGTLQGDCTVDYKDMTDIYPVLFFNQVVKPASWAAKSVYYQLKSNQIGEPQIPSTPSGGGE